MCPEKKNAGLGGVKHNTIWKPPTEGACRNHEGNVLAAATKFVVNCLPPKLAEALCMRWAQVAATLSFNCFCMEADCLPLEQAWKRHKEVPSTYFDGILEDCKVLNRYDFKLLFVKRTTGNRVVDALANLAFIFHEYYWIEDVPHQVEIILLSDVEYVILNE
ncbi:hypothetical protein E2542_SST00704 [Spatholobus suberectus]|nr:hypothetical protein E2542_SST00704 [Spatholobus suberectus]